jgi:DNA-binding NarL/FixJ family response regulator
MADESLLEEVRASAEAALQTRVDGGDRADAWARSLAAARAALDGGHAIAAIARAEAEGEATAREGLGTQVLRLVERSAKKLREATSDYESAIAQAVSVGLPARDIAARAGVSHGTVAAVARRHEQSASGRAEPIAAEAVEGGAAGRGPAAPEDS